MIEILKYVLSDFWIFIGFTIILSIVCSTIAVTVEDVVKHFKK